MKDLNHYFYIFDPHRGQNFASGRNFEPHFGQKDLFIGLYCEEVVELVADLRVDRYIGLSLLVVTGFAAGLGGIDLRLRRQNGHECEPLLMYREQYGHRTNLERLLLLEEEEIVEGDVFRRFC